MQRRAPGTVVQWSAIAKIEAILSIVSMRAAKMPELQLVVSEGTASAASTCHNSCHCGQFVEHGADFKSPSCLREESEFSRVLIGFAACLQSMGLDFAFPDAFTCLQVVQTETSL
eukprot:6455029-Amphidinium_carterae.2